jgi:hypothetical protein
VASSGSWRYTCLPSRADLGVREVPPQLRYQGLRLVLVDPQAEVIDTPWMFSGLSLEREAGAALSLMSLVSRLPSRRAPMILAMIQSLFSAQEGRSQYGLLNAITATARETRDPELPLAARSVGWRTRRPASAASAGVEGDVQLHRYEAHCAFMTV